MQVNELIREKSIDEGNKVALSSSFLSTKEERAAEAVKSPVAIRRELNTRSLYTFLEYFWDVVSNDEFKPNWHIRYLCAELQKIAERVGENKPKEYDLIINIPPGMTKTIICSIMFPAWCWTRWFYMRFITASYGAILSLESAEYSRDLIRSDRFRMVYPELSIKEDKDTKSNFKIVKLKDSMKGRGVALRGVNGGNRYSTSVGGALIGFHGHIHIVDDPLDPKRAASDIELQKANHWCDQTLSTRKTDKKVTTLILIMQRLHQNDPSGHMLEKKGKKIKHICLPGELKNFRQYVSPPEMELKYRKDLLDPVRLGWDELNEMEMDLGQYGYAGQVGQNPVPPGGGMFKVDHFQIVDKVPNNPFCIARVRYWDKAGTQGGGAYTAGVRMVQLVNGKWVIEDVKRGQWSNELREDIIRETAEADGKRVDIWIEQEPGSGGKESAEGTIRNLAGYVCNAECPTGKKEFRADPYSVQVNNGNVLLLRAHWNKEFIEEHRFYPYSTYKDQVDAAAAAFNHLAGKRIAKVWKRRRR
jgi:predicted phage terminase large subunit-like protein